MPHFRDRVCVSCGKVEYNTATSSDVCKLCFIEAKRVNKILEERKFLECMYLNVTGPSYNTHGKRVWSFTHSCGTQQSWVFGNILKLSKCGQIPCSSCGAKSRTANAMLRYVEIYGRDYDLKKFEDYRQRVRYLSNKTYRAYRDEIDPNGYGRSMAGHHLDHIIPIIEGFKRGKPPEEIAAKENLQMLPARHNLSKGKNVCN